MKDTAAGLWQKFRHPAVIKRAETYARYTIPSLMVDPLLATTDQNVIYDFQSVGAVLVNQLAAKLTGLLFPATQPFFKNVLSKELKQSTVAQGRSVEELQGALAQIEIEASQIPFIKANYAKLTRAIKLAVITGNALVYWDTATREFRVWTLHSFVVKRDGNGHWRTVVLKQRFRFDELPIEVQNDARSKNPDKYKDDAQVDFFTLVQKEPGAVNPRVTVKHELDGKWVGPHASYPEHLCPWIVPTWNLADGEDYGRGMVEDHTGDFAKLSLLSEQLGIYELESLQVLNLVNEAGGAVLDDVKNADNGEYVAGKADAISAYERGDYQKIAAINNSLAPVISRLSTAFMYAANTRDAERVTAEEIRQQAKEVESALGGVYSILAESMQTPLAYLMMQEVSPRLLPGLISRALRPQILTGIQALNRSVEIQNLIQAITAAQAIVPVTQQLDPRISAQKVMDLLYRNYSVNTSNVFKDESEMDQEASNLETLADETLLTSGEDIRQNLTSI